MNLRNRIEFSRQYRIDGISMDNVIFYKDGEIVGETNQGWIEKDGGFDTEKNSIYEIDEITEVVRATKENLNRKDCYYRKTGAAKYGHCSKYTLYIYAGLFTSFVPQEELKCNEHSGRIGYANYYQFTFRTNGTLDHALCRSCKQTRFVYNMDGVRANQIVDVMTKLNRHNTFTYSDAIQLMESEEAKTAMIRILGS